VEWCEAASGLLSAESYESMRGVVPTGQVSIRRDIWSLAPDDPVVVWYGKAVSGMRGRQATDPTSWSYQAAIHGTEEAPNRLGWNGCQHGTWFFLPWHRMFLSFFERIVRATVVETGGPTDWALPYWNYGAGGEHAGLPLAFRAEMLASGAPNPLFVGARAQGMTTGRAVSLRRSRLPPVLSRARASSGKRNSAGTVQARHSSQRAAAHSRKHLTTLFTARSAGKKA
jgi:hypothetical protein